MVSPCSQTGKCTQLSTQQIQRLLNRTSFQESALPGLLHVIALTVTVMNC